MKVSVKVRVMASVRVVGVRARVGWETLLDTKRKGTKKRERQQSVFGFGFGCGLGSGFRVRLRVRVRG